MPAFVIAMLQVLGLLATDLPVVEKIIGGFGTLIASEAKKLFGANAGAQVQSGVSFAEGIIQDFDTAVTDFTAEFKTLWPDIDSLINANPFLPKMLLAHQLVAKATPGASSSYVINVVQAAHANVRTTKP